MPHKIDTEEDLINFLPFSYSRILQLIDSLKDDCLWFFKEAYKLYGEVETYYVIFNSYAVEEYKNYLLSIKVELINGEYVCEVVSHVTE